MTLYLVEDDQQERTKEEVSEILERIATLASKSQGELIEALIGEREGRLLGLKRSTKIQSSIIVTE